MNDQWTKLAEQPVSSREQRRCLYRLGLSRHFVHTHLRTREAASATISVMLGLHSLIRSQSGVNAPSPRQPKAETKMPT